MISIFKPVWVAALLATAGFSALAQAPMAAPGERMMGPGADMMQGAGHEHMGKMSPEKMQARQDQRHADLKARLQLNAAQEAAWTRFTAAMKPPAERMERPDRAELAKLSTPERLDKMKALRAEHESAMHAAMDQRDEAIKTFYATLDATQKKVFDASSSRHHGAAGKRPRHSMS